MTETFSFKDLSTEAKARALADYIGGWEETHEVGDLTLMEAYSVLRVDYANTEYDNYTEDGVMISP